MEVEKSVSMFKIAKSNFYLPSPVIAGFEIFRIKRIRLICNDVLIRIFSHFHFNYAKLHKIKMLMIQNLLEMRNIFRRIHITINIRLTPHNIRLFVCKETFNRYIKFILLIRQLIFVIRENTFW